MNKPENKPHQPNALLTFTGEQDAEYFAVALKAAAEFSQDGCGGAREVSIRAEGGNIVLGYKKELDV